MPERGAQRRVRRPLIGRNPFLVVNLAHRLNDSVMLKRAVAATLDIDILSDAPTFRAKTGILWPNLVSLHKYLISAKSSNNIWKLEYHFRIRREIIQYLTKSPQFSHYCSCANCASDEKSMISAELEKAWVSGSPDAVVAALKHRRDNFGSVRCSNFNETLNRLRNNNSWPIPFVPTCEFSEIIL